MRFKEARLQNNLKVIEAAERLGKSQPALSAWESGSRIPPLDLVVRMADLYGVSADYLLGRDYVKADINGEIDPAALAVLHGQPLYSSQYGWVLVNTIKKVLLLVDGSEIPYSDAGRLYRMPQTAGTAPLDPARPLPREELCSGIEVFVEPVSQDHTLRRELRGYYRTYDRFVENDRGNRFFFDSYGVTWLAFQTKN